MIFNSVQFLVFFPIVTAVYFILPKKIRYIWLLIASYYFYMCWNAKYAILLFLSTFVTYVCGLLIEKVKSKEWEEPKKKCYKKIYMISGISINLIILFVFKYYNFAIINLTRVLGFLQLDVELPEFSLILPVGISFYTFQALGYMIDVYRDEIYAEKNLLRYALFVSFFPQLVAGPIERSKNLLVQLQKEQKLTWDNFKEGILLILYGLFLKIVIADRVAVFVNHVYENPEGYQGIFILVATVFFAFQIYCDFYGYSTIARGTALILGIHLMDNFKAPYFSRSIKEFWQRWHISLSSWFRDYLYIPLGGNRKGEIRKEVNLLVVFGVSGLWHGASISYIVWGLLNGIYQVIGDFRKKSLNKYSWLKSSGKNNFSSKMLSQFVTFILVCFAWIFFRAESFSDAVVIIKNMLCFNWHILFDGSLYGLGIAKETFGIILGFIAILLYVDYKKYKGLDVAKSCLKQEWWFQCLIYVGLFWCIVLFGCYGVEYEASQFIYFQF